MNDQADNDPGLPEKQAPQASTPAVATTPPPPSEPTLGKPVALATIFKSADGPGSPAMGSTLGEPVPLSSLKLNGPRLGDPIPVTQLVNDLRAEAAKKAGLPTPAPTQLTDQQLGKIFNRDAKDRTRGVIHLTEAEAAEMDRQAKEWEVKDRARNVLYLTDDELQGLNDKQAADDKFGPQLAAGRQPFASEKPSDDELEYALWLRDNGHLTTGDSPGFWHTVKDLGYTALAGVPEIATQAFDYRKAKLVGTDQEKADAENRDTALSAEVANQAVGVYRTLQAGAERLGIKVAAAAFTKLANYGSDQAFAAKVKKSDDLSWYELHRNLTQIAAQQNLVHEGATELAVRSGWSADGLNNAATAGFLAADPGQLVFAAGGKVTGALLKEFASAAPKIALGTADALRAEVAAGAKQVTAAEQTVSRLSLLRSDEAQAMAESAKAELTAMQEQQAARAATLATLDKQNMAAIEAAGRPNFASRALGKTTAATGGVVESLGEKLGMIDQKFVDGTLEALSAPEKGPVSGFVKRLAPSAVAGSAIGYAVSDDKKSGILGGGLAGLATPAALAYTGRLTRILGENWLIGASTIPYWRRAATDAEANNLEKLVFRQLDRFQLAANVAKEVPASLTKTAATGAAFGYVASGGEDSDQASAAGAAVAGHFTPWGFVSSLHGFFEPISASSYKTRRAGDLRLLKDRWASTDNLARLNSLTPAQQMDIAAVAAANPDFGIKLIGRDNAEIQTDLLAKGSLPTDLSDVPGLHYKDPATGRSVVVLNPSHPDPMRPILAHELTHKAQSEGLAPSMVTELIGDKDLGIPGMFTKLAADGSPIRRADSSFATTSDFEQAKKTYIGRLGRVGVDATAITDAEFALEYAAEIGSNYLTSDKFADDLNPTLGSLMGETFTTALRDTLGSLGVPFMPDQTVRGTMEFGVRQSPAVEKMIRAYAKRWSLGLNRTNVSEDKVPKVQISKEQILKNPSILEMFKASGSLNIDPKTGDLAGTRIDETTGKRVIVDQAKMFKSVGEVAQEQAALSQHIIDAVKKAGDVGADKDAVKVTTEKGQEVASGRYLSEETFAALEASGRYNPYQLQTLRNVSSLIKAGTGDYLRIYYQAASRNGDRYQSLAGTWRTEVPYGLFISKADNILIRTLAPDRFVANLEGLWSKEHERASALWSNQVSMISDGWKYLQNLSTGRPGADGLSVEKRDLLNLGLGLKSAAKGEANPLYDSNTHKSIDSAIVSRRLDRINRATAPEAKTPLPWDPEAYKRGLLNLSAGKTESLPGAETPTQPTSGTGDQPEQSSGGG